MPPTRSARQRRIEALAQRDFERHAARRAHLEVPMPDILVSVEGMPMSFSEYVQLLHDSPSLFGLNGPDFWDNILGGHPKD